MLLYLVDTATCDPGDHYFQISNTAKFSSGFQMGITSNGNQGQPEQMLFEPLLICHRNRQTAVADSNMDDHVQQ